MYIRACPQHIGEPWGIPCVCIQCISLAKSSQADARGCDVKARENKAENIQPENICVSILCPSSAVPRPENNRIPTWSSYKKQRKKKKRRQDLLPVRHGKQEEKLPAVCKQTPQAPLESSLNPTTLSTYDLPTQLLVTSSICGFKIAG
jgi:hypothetical protein